MRCFTPLVGGGYLRFSWQILTIHEKKGILSLTEHVNSIRDTTR